MTHSTTLVILAPDQTLEDALAPFDENIEVEPYVYSTREQRVAERRKRHAEAAANLAKLLADPDEYPARNNAAHLVWIIAEAPAEAALSDEELAAIVDKYLVLEESGDELTTYNPKSRWDWWTVGGRWGGELVTKSGDHVNETTVGQLDLGSTPPTFAVLTPDGTWHERGKMGWWAIVSDEKEEAEWVRQWRSIVDFQPDDARVVLVDVHI